jgi:protocatechuate 3,4-dioxygenase beta subunit
MKPRLLHAACFALLLARLLDAQSPAVGPYRVAGRVVNAATGLPVRSASVSLLNEDNTSVEATTLSDAEGNFAFDRIAPGKYPLTASKRGFRTGFYDEHDEFSSAIVAGPGQDTTHLAFQLKPGAVLFGNVSDDGGDPVEGASLMLFKSPSHPGERITAMTTVTTDDAGDYEFADLPEGTYFIAVQAQPWYAMHNLAATGGTPSPLDVTYPLTFYDSVTQEAGASPITLESGARQEANISLHAVPSVRVKVLGSGAGGTVPPTEVHQVVFGNAIPWGGGDLESVGGQPGSISLPGLAPGHYIVTHGNPPRTVELDASATQEIADDEGATTVSVGGSVRTTSGAPLDSGTVELDPGPDAPGHAALNAPLEKGRFHIDGVAPGQWNLTVSAGGSTQSNAAIVSIGEAGRSSSGNEITVGDHPLNLSILVSRSQSKVQGFARQGGKPLPGAMIVLVPRNPRAFPSLSRRDESDSDGSFSVRDVPAGQYTAIALADGWKLDWQRFEVIRRFLPGGVSVEVPEHADVVRLSRPVQAATP